MTSAPPGRLKDELYRQIHHLNAQYRLGIPVPELNAATHYGQPALEIYSRLEALYHVGGLEGLEALLAQFKLKVEQYWALFSKKPQGGAAPLRALLQDVLDKSDGAALESGLNGRVQQRPVVLQQPAHGPPSALKTPTKRQSDIRQHFPNKRQKKVDFVQDHKTAVPIDANPPQVEQQDRPTIFATRQNTASSSREKGTSFQSFTSANTNETSFSSVFSAAKGPQSTQESLPSPTSETQDALASLARSFDASGDVQPRWDYTVQARSETAPGAGAKISVPDPKAQVQIATVLKQLESVWPRLPPWLSTAPFSIRWEITRIALSCSVDIATVDLQDSPDWKEQKAMRMALWKHPAFQGKAFPESSPGPAWAASLDRSLLAFDQHIVYSASLELAKDRGTNSKTPMQLVLQPLKLDHSHRLSRFYGADRFFDLLVPSPDSVSVRALIKDTESFFKALVLWLIDKHEFCGRIWKAFYTKSGGSRKPQKDLHFGPEQKPMYKERVYFFAEDDQNDPEFSRVSLKQMLKWGLSLRTAKNRKQPVLKLFQRLALLLSKTSPAIVFEPHQISHMQQDILSPTSNVMNDGIARMSPAVARLIQQRLGLLATPTAVQGRFGSAKGMWIVATDLKDDDTAIWIETYPSQRKWELEPSSAPTEHRTLEVHGYSLPPRPARFNLQLLPVLEDRAVDKQAMRQAVGDLLQENLQKDLAGQKKALQSPLQFRQWCHENPASGLRQDRVLHGYVLKQGSAPKEDQELMNTMLDAGFDPKSNKMLADIAYGIQKRKCDSLSTKLNITVGRSAYLYMVLDFQGILKENEVHIGFSTAFQADKHWSKTMVQGPVLVARSPAHFPSDIQKVQAVFKPELANLTDVIVFSSKGNVPLADCLSGGDMDGDQAWTCWEPAIVDNFENAQVPEQPDLSRWLSKDKETLNDILTECKDEEEPLKHAIDRMLHKCFEFNLAKSMLGVCTIYKERFCYERNTVSNEASLLLSTLLSNLVDQAKQGISFTEHDFRRLLQDHGLPGADSLREPLYKCEHLNGGQPNNIIDFLKFEVAKPTIATELKAFASALRVDNKSVDRGPSHWDRDLASYYHGFDEPATSDLLQHLRDDIEGVAKHWDLLHRDDSLNFSEKVQRVYERWQGIEPTANFTDTKLHLGGEMSQWALLKASTAFYMYCNSGGRAMKPRFVWQMACTQLCYIKAQSIASMGGLSGASGAPAVVVPELYAGLRPDARFVKQITAKMEGGSLFSVGNDDDGDAGDEDDS
ncbi:RNA dependent RNA polymerase-domain-containing protein [Coniella lustricola]|uniref:RNA-dependent RNA polymerase n=1 Tax=Coniella lustricola TaxID=2025994 RepID=A0A2T3A172_9PEZI|nr:RNA dependent RNA polymerase-domain-containing protein [Coniella lustricola]